MPEVSFNLAAFQHFNMSVPNDLARAHGMKFPQLSVFNWMRRSFKVKKTSLELWSQDVFIKATINDRRVF